MIFIGTVEWYIARAIAEQKWDNWGEEDVATYLCRTILRDPDVLGELNRRIGRSE